MFSYSKKKIEKFRSVNNDSGKKETGPTVVFTQDEEVQRSPVDLTDTLKGQDLAGVIFDPPKTMAEINQQVLTEHLQQSL